MMYHPFLRQAFGSSPFFGGAFAAGVGLVIVLVIIWSLIWKALALWRAARQGSKIWFIVLMIVNTLGILEILYLFIFSKKNMKDMMKPAKPIASGPDDSSDATTI